MLLSLGKCAKYGLEVLRILVLEIVRHNSCRILPKYGEEHKGEEEAAMTEEAA